jgi:hypothetical protein
MPLARRKFDHNASALLEAAASTVLLGLHGRLFDSKDSIDVKTDMSGSSLANEDSLSYMIELAFG